MPFRFCPQCGSKLQPGFKFCPSCGEQLPSPADECGPVGTTSSTSHSPLRRDEATISVAKTSQALSTSNNHRETSACLNSSIISPRPALRKTRISLRLDRNVKVNTKDAAPPVTLSTHPVADDWTEDKILGCQVTPSKQKTVAFKHSAEVEPVESSPSPVGKSPRSGKGKAKRAKHAPAVEPLQEREELTDTTGKKWTLVKLVNQNMTELIYEVSEPDANGSNHILKLGAKDGRIFTEQNFLQRAAKPSSVDKWIRQNMMDFLGIPSCVGFGLHADSYRFLIFPNMGESLQSYMKDNELLPEKTVLQLSCRILDVLQYIHSNEYVHADINSENIYIKPRQSSQVYLVGYCYAFRYCPNGQHVEYREASRMPHEGSIEFISLDAHKGAALSRRSDLQSLGYCMLRWHTGKLPWSTLTDPGQVATQKQRYMEDIPGLLRHCFGRTVPSVFQNYLTAVMALQYSEQPDYSDLKAGLEAALQLLGGTMKQPLSF